MALQSATFGVLPDHVDDAVRWASDVLHSWGVRSSLGRAWVSAATTATQSGPCQLDLEYDKRASLLSVDVWQAGRRVFGLDDWVTAAR